ncbi:MAG TPA: hypothetical protein VMW43_04865 [Bacteroidota bacterium]|nr:hypothetical protein [Bacteroidota bacterium]
MKTPMLYIAVFTGSLLLLFQVALILLMVKPGLFLGKGAVAPGAAAVVDTLAAQAKPPAGGQQAAAAASTGISADSVQSLRNQLNSARDLIAQMQAQIKPNVPAPAPDSTQMKLHKEKAKLLESMSPENAAHVLKNMDDDDVKNIIMFVKKRQAGKILAMLEPERAAKIFK